MDIPACTLCGRDKRGPNPLCWHCAKDCPHMHRDPVKIRKANGLEEVRLRCSRCGDLDFGYSNRDFQMASLPVHRDNSGRNPPCIVCGQADTELHHFAPTALFGWQEAERWPKDWLCRDCHTRWHRIMRAGARPA